MIQQGAIRVLTIWKHRQHKAVHQGWNGMVTVLVPAMTLDEGRELAYASLNNHPSWELIRGPEAI